jgi:hypothetical protein
MPQNRGRNRFVFSFFVLGTVLPLVFDELRYVAGAIGRLLDAVSQWIWVIWPTWIFMLGTQDTVMTIVTLLWAALLNGLWYAVVATTLWYTAALLKRLVRYGVGQKT